MVCSVARFDIRFGYVSVMYEQIILSSVKVFWEIAAPSVYYMFSLYLRAWIAQWFKHSLATTATHDRIQVSASGRVVVARPRSVVFRGFSGFLHHV